MFNKTTIAFTLMLLLCGATVNAQVHISPEPQKQNTNENNDRKTIARALNSIRSHTSLGKYDQALELLNKLELNFGNRAEIVNERKRILKASKDFVTLKKIITDELSQSPDNFGITCQLGEVYFLCDSLDKAEETWEKAFDLAGENSFNYMMLANYYHGYGFYNEAVSVYIRGRNVIGQPELFIRELSDIYITQKQYSKAVTEYLKLLEIQSNPKEIQQLSWEITNMYDEAESPELIIEAVKRAAGDNSARPELYIILGDLYLKNGQLSESFENYRKGDSLSEDEGFYLDNFIKLCYDQEQYVMAVEAANYYLAGVEYHKKRSAETVIIYKARSLAELGSYNTAFELLEIVEKDYNSFRARAEALYTAGEIYSDKLQDKSKAREKFNELIKTSGNLPLAQAAQLKLAEIDIQEMKLDQAKEKLLKVAEIRKGKEDGEKARYLLAEIEFFNEDYQAAAKAYNILFSEYPRGKYINDCLERLTLITDAEGDSMINTIAKATRLSFAGRPDSAIVYLKQASQSSGSKVYEYALYYLPSYYADMGNWETAIGAYKHYLTAFEDGVYTDRALLDLSRIYIEKAQRPDKADELLNKLITDFPYSPLLEQARIYLNKLDAS